MQLKDRLNRLLARKSMTQQQLADAINVSRQAVQFWTSGRSEPKGVNLAKISEYFEVSPSWLQSGGHADPYIERVVISPFDQDENADDDRFVSIPEYRLTFAAGDKCGAEPSWEELHEAEACAYRQSFFANRRINPEKCKRVRVTGDSMEPTLYDGDKVLFVDGYERIVDGAVYAISFCGDMRLKRLYRKANGGIIIHSDNPRYPDETIEPEEQDLLRIYGRVIDRSGSGGL